MGRVYTRDEWIVELAAAAGNLREVSSRGDVRRFADDRVFRFAVAFLWLRLAEPACQLVTRRLVSEGSRRAWEGMFRFRNMLAHERGQDIDFVVLWAQIPSTLDGTEAQVKRLTAAGCVRNSSALAQEGRG
jgi:uncharacterized protein with HEPN domain